MKKRISLKYGILSIALLAVVSCDKVNDQVPQNSQSSGTAISTPVGARVAILGAYDNLQGGNYYGTRYTFFPDMQGGNLTWTGTFPSFGQIANRVTLADNVEVTNMWAAIYDGINRVNQILDKAAKIQDPSFTDQAQILGEASFLRALHYFNLVRYWGGVPLKLTPTDAVNVSELQLSRNSVSEVYTQILSDIDFALTNLPPTQTNRARATLGAVNALKARVHLYRSSSGIANEYDLAIAAAVAASTGRTLTANFSDLFVARNMGEVIWYLEFNSVDQNSLAFFLLPSTSGGRNELRPSASLQSAFSVSDTRRIATNAVSNTLKYYRVSTGDDYVLMFRLAEMMLIQAEAMVERNTGTDLTDALALINQIRNRAGIGTYVGLVSQAALRDEVFSQRRLELALEGHYFFDLVRTGRAATVLTSPIWDSKYAVFPIPLRETQANPNLQQNPGY